MGYGPRLITHEFCFHVLNRGNDRQCVFYDDDDHRAFLNALGQTQLRYPFRLYGYFLMSNHFHLLLRTEPGVSISRVLQSLTIAHTWRYHKRHGTVGRVWQGRFKSPAVGFSTNIAKVRTPSSLLSVTSPTRRWAAFRPAILVLINRARCVVRLACAARIAVKSVSMNAPYIISSRGIASPGRTFAAVTALVFIGLTAVSRGQTSVETLETPSGQHIEGWLEGENRSGFRFRPREADTPIAIQAGSIIQANGSGADSLAGLPPFRVLVGESLRLSGLIRSISESSVRVKLSWQGEEVTLPRPGVQSVIQRPGEARILADGFERLDASRWSIEGKASIVADPHLSEQSSLRLGADGASVIHRLAEPLPAGRIDLAFFDDGSVVPGRQWFAELTFQGPAGPLVIKVDLGWNEESLAVECPRGPSLPVQRLARTRGWHRLAFRFGPGQIEISVDGKELAHGNSLDGQLASIRLASSRTAPQNNSKDLAGYVDDLQIIRFAEPAASFEIDITQDEARLVAGDQLFGEVKQADGDRVLMAVEGSPVHLSWSEVAGLFFRRLPAQGATVDGLLARVEWRAAAGDDPVDLDFAEGAIVAATGKVITMATPYSGVLRIPRTRIRKIAIFGEGRRVVIDPAAHHLGDEPSRVPPLLDPPLHEGGLLERTVELTDVPDAQALLVMDVVQVVGEDNDPNYSQFVRKGELITWVKVNGQRIDFLNRYIKTRDDTPERLAIPIPAGLLHAGKNTLRLELTGMASKAEQLDDFGVLGIALDFRRKPNGASQPAR